MAKISQLPLVANPDGLETVVVLKNGEAQRMPARPLVDASVGAAVAGFDSSIDGQWTNVLPFGDFVGGDASTRSGSPIVALDHTDFRARGIARGIRWRAGNEFVRFDAGASLLGKYFFGAFVVHSPDPANLNASAHVFEETSTGGTGDVANLVAGYRQLSATARLLWTTGLVDSAVTRLILGSPAAPAVPNTRLAGDFWLIVADQAIDPAIAIRHINIAAKARLQSRSWALAATSRKMRSTLVLNGPDAEGFVESNRAGFTVRNSFTPFPTQSGLTDSTGTFQLGSTFLNGTRVRAGGDDNAPDHAATTTIGGNHGYVLGLCTAAGHGKTVADEGSVWLVSGADRVLVKVVDANTLLIATIAHNGVPPTGTFGHVSGASNVAPILVTAAVSQQWYPPHIGYSLKWSIDGDPLTDTDGTFDYRDSAAFVETADILSRQDIINWWVSNGGARAGMVPPNAAPLYRLVITYRFDRDGQLTIHRDWLFLRETPVIDLMGLQLQRTDLPLTYRVPGAVPLQYDGSTLDYGTGVASGRTLQADGTPSINFGAAQLQGNGGEYGHRVISEWADHVMITGIAPVGDAAYGVRRAMVATRALELRGNSAKLYFRIVDRGAFTALPGEAFSAIGFRHVFPRLVGRPTVCPVRISDRRAILYIDRVDYQGLDQVALPADLIGRSVGVLDSRNVVLFGSGSITGNLTANVAANGDHAYLVLDLAA